MAKTAQEYYEEGLRFYEEEKFAKAFDNFCAAANLGHTEAQNRVGLCYLAGEGTDKDYKLAYGWFEKALVPDLACPDASYNMGRCYFYGYGTQKNTNMAFGHFMSAAQMGHIDAKNAVAVQYLTGEGVREDNEKAIKWLENAYEQDPKNCRTNCNLAFCYRNGYGVEKDVNKAYDYYKVAADQNYAKAQYMVGYMHMNHELEYINYSTGIEYFQKAADNGHKIAMYEIGAAYEAGNLIGYERDLKKAVEYFEKAAELGEINALMKLGEEYVTGGNLVGKVVDLEKGLKYCHRSLELDNEFAASFLLRVYELGMYGVPASKQKALEVCKIAVGKGYIRFDAPLKRLRKLIRDEQVQNAQPAAAKPKDENAAVNSFDEVLRQLASDNALGAMNRLQKLIGLDSVKEEVCNIIKLHEFNKKRLAYNLAPLEISRHMVFTGKPGTGKTTVARLIGEVYHEMGLLQKAEVYEVKRQDLVAEYIGQTAPKTQKCIDKAMGGILFIDEAYTITKPNDERDFGHEAVEAIMNAMEDNREDLMVIVAGYEKEMRQFLDINLGLKSRFGENFINFEDYKPEELNQIFHKMAGEGKNQIMPDAEPILADYFEKIYRTRDEEFGNARAVRNFYDTIIKEKVNRLGDISKCNLHDFALTKADIQAAVAKLVGGLNEDEAPVMEQLENMIGLGRVKEEIRELRQVAVYQKLCRDKGVSVGEPPTMHMVFTGNPGTGKTTVARLIGKIYKELGLLPKGHVVEVKREDLIGSNVGSTAPKTKQVIKQAMGGVLFIDEAYSLSKEAENDFGKEAIETLLAEMEQRRESMAVIVAGYEEDMRRFINSNAGLRSRFTRYIHFDDYNGQELAQIFKRLAKGYSFGEGAEKELERLCREKYENRGKNFGNGRDIRNLFFAVTAALAARVSVMDNPTVEDLTCILREDILTAEQKQKRIEDREPKPKKNRLIGFNPTDNE